MYSEMIKMPLEGEKKIKLVSRDNFVLFWHFLPYSFSTRFHHIYIYIYCRSFVYNLMIMTWAWFSHLPKWIIFLYFLKRKNNFKEYIILAFYYCIEMNIHNTWYWLKNWYIILLYVYPIEYIIHYWRSYLQFLESYIN